MRRPWLCVAKAVADGKLDAGRLENYHRIIQSLDQSEGARGGHFDRLKITLQYIAPKHFMSRAMGKFASAVQVG